MGCEILVKDFLCGPTFVFVGQLKKWNKFVINNKYVDLYQPEMDFLGLESNDYTKMGDVITPIIFGSLCMITGLYVVAGMEIVYREVIFPKDNNRRQIKKVWYIVF